MRLGGHVFADSSTPEKWIAALKRSGYRAAYCPLNEDADDDVVRAYAEAAREADVVIAEVGAWSNPISPDDDTRRDAQELCKKRLDLADRIGAACCVNIAGSRADEWAGPHPDNLSEETFDIIVEVTRDIIDSVRPTRTFYTLETMPWVFPDSPQSYACLIEAIDRERFAVHLDPVNLICSPQRFFRTGDVIRECFAALGPYVKSCHAKDVAMSDEFIAHLNETRPGLGRLDYYAFLQELSKLDPDVPLMLEHLPDEGEYALAAQHIRSVARELDVSL
ncbi:MAG: sugar phosphate isomerase/epimerase family protein [Armatimonadota bacterium]